MPEDKEAELMAENGVLLFPREPVIMRSRLLEQKYGDSPLRMSSRVQFSFSTGIMVSKRFGYKRMLNRVLGRISAMGLVEKLRRDYYPTKVRFTPL